MIETLKKLESHLAIALCDFYASFELSNLICVSLTQQLQTVSEPSLD